MAFNRLADRDVDAQNPRTAVRHLPSGQLSVASVWLFTLFCCAGFIASTAIFLARDNPWPLYLRRRRCCCSFSPIPPRSASPRWPTFGSGPRCFWRPVAAWMAIRGFEEWYDPARHRPGGLLLGRRLRHHLRLPGRRLRPPGQAAQHPRPPRRSGRRCGWPRCSHALMLATLVAFTLLAAAAAPSGLPRRPRLRDGAARLRTRAGPRPTI